MSKLTNNKTNLNLEYSVIKSYNKNLHAQFIKIQAINKIFEDLDICTFITNADKWICKIIKSLNNKSLVSDNNSSVSDNKSSDNKTSVPVNKSKTKKTTNDFEIIGADQNDNFLRFIPPYNYTCTAENNCSKPAAFKSKLDSNCYCWLHIHYLL